MKVWITKYALSVGIIEADAKESAAYPGMVVIRREGRFDECFHNEGKDWHRTLTFAQTRADKMRVAKIASLEKQIAKLRALTFAVPEDAR
jgi:hypothetical protein